MTRFTMLFCLLTLTVGLALPANAQKTEDPVKKSKPVVPKWRKQLDANLAKKITVDFKDTPVSDVVAFLSAIAKVDIVVDPRSKLGFRKLTLRLGDVTVKQCLDVATRLLDSRVRLCCGFVVLGTEANLKRYREKPIAFPRGMRADLVKRFGRPVTLDFDDVSVSVIAGFLSNVLKVNLALGGKIDLRYGISLTARHGTPAINVLTLLGGLADADMTFVSGVLIYKARKKKEKAKQPNRR